MNKHLSFQRGSEKQIKVSCAGRKESLFYESYRQALAGVAEIIRSSIVYTQGEDCFFPLSPQKINSSYAPQHDHNYYNYPNNIILFSGSRGIGKSSALLTFVDGLARSDSPMWNNEFLEDMVKRELQGVTLERVSRMFHSSSFVTLPPIDPTVLEDSGQILTVILSSMYHLADKAWEHISEKELIRNWSHDRVSQKNELLRKFNTCFEHIRAVKGFGKKIEQYDSLEILANLGDSSHVKSELHDLVKDLLRFCCPDSGKTPYLVVQIDDTDMNTQQAYNILEDIRKYLVIPRVIIVMAADMENLLNLVESAFAKGGVSQDYSHNTAAQYITKLIPQTRQINLPPLNSYLREHMDSVRIEYQNPDESPVIPDSEEGRFPDNQEQIFRLIYRKTGLIFLKPGHDLHYIIPDNMRLLSHFLAIFSQMQDVARPECESPGFFVQRDEDRLNPEKVMAHKDMLQVRLQNVERFRSYFEHTWCKHNLRTPDAELLQKVKIVGLAEKVDLMCDELQKRIGKNESTEILSKQNNATPYMRMIAMLRHYEKSGAQEWDKKFAFAVHTYFSLLSTCLVLEDLVAYYEAIATEPANSPIHDELCAFERLYMLYGSRIFSYDEQIENGFKGMIPISQVSSSLERETLLQSTKSTLRLAYTMLADYNTSVIDDNVLLDVCTPLLNCLYIKGGTSSSQFTEGPLSGIVHWAMTGGRLRWESTKASALIVILNWDVQRRIQERLLRPLSICARLDASPNSTVSSMIQEALKNFYAQLVSVFNVTEIGAESKERNAISCLDHISFAKWLELAFPDRLTEGNQGFRPIANALFTDTKCLEHLDGKADGDASVKTAEPI